MAGKRKNIRFCQNDTPKSVEYSVLFEAISVNSLTLEPCKSFLMLPVKITVNYLGFTLFDK